MKTFSHSREQSRQIVIESSPVGEAIVRLMEKTALVWKGTASELLNELEQHTDEATYRARYFPKASNMLKRQLTRLTPDLKALGVLVSETVYNGSKEPKNLIKIGDRVKPADPDRERGQDTGILGSIEGEQYVVQWQNDGITRRYTRDELVVAA